MKNDLAVDQIAIIMTGLPAALDAAQRNLIVITVIGGIMIVCGVLAVLRNWGPPSC